VLAYPSEPARINDVMLHSTSSLFFDGTKQSEELELGWQVL
jgi:hypothetical protein